MKREKTCKYIGIYYFDQAPETFLYRNLLFTYRKQEHLD
jgi:hypothetical protein